MVKINIERLNDGGWDDKTVCISCSLFKMKSSYRSFDKYTSSFMNWYRQIPINAYVRLYIDESILNERRFIETISNLNVEVILVDCPDFKMEYEPFHDGTFMSITRFLSLYEYPPLPSSVDTIWISDIDMPSYNFSKDNLNYLSEVDLIYNSNSFYKKPWVDQSVKFPIINEKIICKRGFFSQRTLFDKFLEDVVSGVYTKLMNEIVKLREAMGKKTDFINLFPYGFDELFTNSYLIQEIRSPYMVMYNIDLQNVLKSFDRRHPYHVGLLINKIDDIEKQVFNRREISTNFPKYIFINKQIYVNLSKRNNTTENERAALKDFNTYIEYVEYIPFSTGLRAFIYFK
jgi:hypothetical protein